MVSCRDTPTQRSETKTPTTPGTLRDLERSRLALSETRTNLRRRKIDTRGPTSVRDRRVSRGRSTSESKGHRAPHRPRRSIPNPGDTDEGRTIILEKGGDGSRNPTVGTHESGLPRGHRSEPCPSEVRPSRVGSPTGPLRYESPTVPLKSPILPIHQKVGEDATPTKCLVDRTDTVGPEDARGVRATGPSTDRGRILPDLVWNGTRTDTH